MIIFIVLFSAFNVFACEIDKEISIAKILSRNNALPTIGHFEKYITSLMTKAPLREKYCGEKLDSPQCLEKLRKLDIPSLLKIQDSIINPDPIIHENSSQNDIDEFVVSEFSESEGRHTFKSADKHRMPLILEMMNQKDHILNMLYVHCSTHMKYKNGVIQLEQTSLNSSEKLVEFMRTKQIPVYDATKSAFEESILFIRDAEIAAEFYSLCLENAEKSCEQSPGSDICELKRNMKATALYYSQYFHMLAYFELSREDGNRLYSSTNVKLMSKLVLQTPEFIADFNRKANQDPACVTVDLKK